ncbi:MAG: caspase family protein [Candidatus Sphingomonas colombiensis]|nr:caspase family protein [Sphingomonas sp.]WEK44075.1 MAG: caspase family protein [Sphingomonas sp.]
MSARAVFRLMLWLLPMWLLCAEPATAATRALVIAADYVGAEKNLHLANAIVDGRLIAAALSRAGVADIQSLEEANAEAWQEGLAAFLSRLRKEDVALVYYAGHGLQVGGRNYFLAADGVSLLAIDAIVQQIADRAGASIIIIDACRNNPFQSADSGQSVLQVEEMKTGGSRALATIAMSALRDGAAGLAQLGELRGMSTVALFSTEPGNVAFDGEPGRGSFFACAVAVELARRQSLNAAFRRIVTSVNRETDGQQSPWRQGDLPRDVFLAGMPHFPVP